MDLKTIRKQIDKVDDQLVELLETRIKLVLKALPHKQSVVDGQRESEIISRAIKQTSLLSEGHLREIFNSCFKESKRHIKKR